MELNVNIDPEQINKMVADAILQSAIGTQVKKIVDEHVAKLSNGYNNPIEGVVRDEINRIVRNVLLTDHNDTLRLKVAEAVTAKMTDEFVSKIVESGLRNY